jgi:hypothetical protein
LKTGQVASEKKFPQILNSIPAKVPLFFKSPKRRTNYSARFFFFQSKTISPKSRNTRPEPPIPLYPRNSAKQFLKFREPALPSEKKLPTTFEIHASQSTTFFKSPKRRRIYNYTIFFVEKKTKKTSPNKKHKGPETPLPTLTRVYSKTPKKKKPFVVSWKS